LKLTPDFSLDVTPDIISPGTDSPQGQIMTPEDTEDDRIFIPWSEFQSLTKIYNDFDTPRTLKPLDWLKLQGTPAEMFTVMSEGATQVVMADGRVWIEYQKHVYKALGDDAKAKTTLWKLQRALLRFGD